MENAVEALKMSFAVAVFVIAMSLGFMMITQAKATADVVFSTTDSQEYVTGITSIGQSSEKYRTVGLDTIIPTIYRYSKENYGVTIIENNEIIAIYDLQVEDNISEVFTRRNDNDTNQKKYDELCYGIKEYIQNATGINVSVDENLFISIYNIKNPDSTSCPWTMDIVDTNRRIQHDMKPDGTRIAFSGNNTLKYCNQKLSNGFISMYGTDTFTEYYYQIIGKNPMTGEDEVERLQIIYVKN